KVVLQIKQTIMHGGFTDPDTNDARVGIEM
ncbi:MAG: hypothetical protein QOJ59_283, partial [Thermomicrobiales bacterium]|nr:hypothetical protein [Thermomicrobiales bacterium]